MDASIIEKLTSLISTLQGEGKLDLVELATSALKNFKGGDAAAAMASLVSAAQKDDRFKELLGKGGETIAQVGDLAKAAGGLLGKLV